jgi:hypothetical protein
MQISEQELREMVREAIARYGAAPSVRAAAAPALPAGDPSHASHGLLALASGDADGQCVIEPAVRCTHCGYCLSLGH